LVHAQTFKWAYQTAYTTGNQKICTSPQNAVFLSGHFSGAVDLDFGTSSSIVTSPTGWQNAFFARYDSSGQLIWANALNAHANISISGMVADSFNNLYIAGYYAGVTDFDPGPNVYNLSTSSAFDRNLFIAKYDSSGMLMWVKGAGGVFLQHASDIQLDAHQDLLITGTFESSCDFGPGPGSTLIAPSSSNTYILKLDKHGNFKWVRQFEGNSNSGQLIQVDNQLQVYVFGVFSGTVDFDPGPGTMLKSATNSAVYLEKLDSNGHLIWVIVLENDSAFSMITPVGVEVDTFHHVYLAGMFVQSVDIDPGPGSLVFQSYGQTDAYLVKLDSTGALIWGKQMGNAYNDKLAGLQLDAGNNCYLMGQFSDTLDIDPGPGVMLLYSPANHAYVLKLEASGNFVSTLHYGGNTATDNLLCNAIEITDDEHIYTSGTLGGTADFNPGSGQYVLSSLTVSGDLYLSKLEICGSIQHVSYTACDSMLLFGNSYHQSTQFLALFSDVTGCDSSYYVTLEITKRSRDTLSYTACSAVSVNGISYQASGVYQQYFSHASGCDSVLVLLISIEINDSIVQVGSTLQSLTSGASYQWVYCPSYLPIPGATNQQYTPVIAGQYAVIITTSNCVETSICKTVSVTDLEVVEDASLNQIEVSPNPGESIFHIRTPKPFQKAAYQIYNVLGKCVLKGEQMYSNQLICNLSGLADGMYICLTQIDGKPYAAKLQKLNR
jgi:hypothetical protein